MGIDSRPCRGFSLVELVIVVVIVGLLAAIAIPRFSRGASGASEAALTADLAALRNAIDRYAAEHGGDYPVAATFSDQLTGYSNAAGEVSTTRSDDYPFGPYLHAVPALKAGYNAGSDVVISFSGTPGSAIVVPGGTLGWLYNPGTGQIWANDSNHLDK